MSSVIMDTMQGPLCGTLATMFLYGVICMQVFHYATNDDVSDRRTIKWLVWIVLFLETLHTAFSVHFIEYYLIINFDDPAALNYEVWSVGAAYITGTLVSCVVDLFFVWRIWQLSKRTFMCILLVVPVIAFAGIGIATASAGLQIHEFTTIVPSVRAIMVLGWALTTLADCLIAMALCYHLHKQRNGMKKTDHVINILVMYTINTGALTSLFSILVIIAFLTLPLMAFIAFVQVSNKLYAVSFFASLNAGKRALQYAERAVPTTTSVPLSFFRNHGKVRMRSTSPAIEIRKDVVHETFPPPLDEPLCVDYTA